ncbi:MAG TPA: 6-bladed beta-propeller [Candidatus Saccharicenans sp.]|jgi:hypothetical protein|nr:6-bladed beta-propeller [Candidatus Saccharicenans sp.]HRD01620.1 6-bladed beta-propeller [Candidatus Saccharicenans sp.]
MFGLTNRTLKIGSIILFLFLSFSCSPKEPSRISISITPEWTLGENEGDLNCIFGGISGIEEDLEGNIYVLDFKFWNLRKFDKNRKFVKTIASRGVGPGEISQFPVAMTLKNEKIYVILMNPVFIYDTEGNFLKTFKPTILPMYIAVEPAGNVVLANAEVRPMRQLFYIFDPEGQLKTSFGEGFPAPNQDFKKITENWLPSSIFISGDGKLYVTDPFEYAIYVYLGTKLEKKITRKSANFEPPQVIKDEKGNYYKSGGLRTVAEYGDYLLVFLEGKEKGWSIEVLDKESYKYLGSTEMDKRGYLMNVSAGGSIFVWDEDEAKIIKYKLSINP